MKPSGAEQSSWFTTTHWSVVLNAADSASRGAQEALEKLCQAYWYPLYAYVRRQGRSPEDAQDLTQEFFARFLEKKFLESASPERGRFRAFLLTCLKNFLINQWERAQTAKRGGGALHMPMDAVMAETLYSREPTHNLTAEKIYERNCAMAVIQEVRMRLQQEYAASGRSGLFGQLEMFLPGEKSDQTYGEVARRLGIPEGTLKSDVNRFKKRYRELLRAEVAHTVASPAEVNEELRHLIAVLSGD